MTKAPVEVTGARTEFSTTYALPDGAFRVDRAAGPLRVAKPDGSWADIDLGLVQGKDGWSPASSPQPVTFSAGGSGPAAVFNYEGRSVSLLWPDKLPEPTVDGATATYAVSANEDLVLEAKAQGFEQSLVIKKKPAADDPAPVLSLPLALDGVSLSPARAAADKKPGKSLTLDATADGGKSRAGGGHANGRSKFAGKDEKVQAGDRVFAIQQATMFDASRDAKTGEPSQIQALTPKTVAVPSSGPAAKADTALELTADKAFLDDPDTQYPVTIDPVITSDDQYGDTWIDQANPDTSYSSSSTLKTGLFGGNLAGTLIGFNNDNPVYFNQHVTSANLNLYNMGSGSCTASTLPVYPLTAGFDSSTTWNTGGANWRTDYSGSKSFAHGFSGSCPAAAESIDVTNIVAAWAFGDIDDYGFFLPASDSDSTQSKTFCSMDLGASPCNVASHEPTLSLTYNSYPWDPQDVTFSPRVEGTTGRTYSTSLSPTFQAQVGNSDGTPVKLEAEVSWDPAYAEGTGVVWDGVGAGFAPLSTATVTVSTPLTTAKHYQYRVRGVVTNGSGGTDAGPWSSYQTLQTNTSLPAAPTISCGSYPANTWTASAGSVSCSLSTTSTDGSGYWWGLDDPSVSNLQDNGTNTGATQSVSINPAAGYHTLYARTRDTARLQSASTTKYTFGVGAGGMITPKNNAQTQQSIGVVAQSKSTYTTFSFKYHVGTDSSSAWTNVPTANVYAVGSGTPISAWPTGTVSGSVTNYPQLNWNIAATGVPEGALQMIVCFAPSGTTCGATSNTVTLVLAKTAFSGTAAQSNVGPGTVSLVTGDFAVDETDVSAGGLSIGRTNTNLTPPAASSGPSGIFGAGWTTATFGPDAGVGMYTLTDSSGSGSVTLSDSSGTKAIYTGSTTFGSTFTGIGDAADGSTLVKSGSASPYTWTLTETDGTKTIWKQQGTTSTYNPDSVVETGTEGTTTYTRDGNSRVTQIVGAPPTGVTCSTPLTTKGCRTLTVTYAGSTTATGTAEANWGNYTGLVSGISYTAWNPAASPAAMATTTVASYLYDNTGHLRAEWDPRISPALKTRYHYDSNGRLDTETDPGRATWTMTYDGTGRLSAAARPDPNTSTTATTAVVYGLGLSGTGLPDVTSATAATWNQTTDQAYAGAAVFPASHPPTGSAGSWTPSSTDWPYADLTYYDVNGRPVNTAQYGADAWQIDSTRYDDTGNTIWSLSARNRAQALNPTSDTDPYTASQPSTAGRADLLATINTYSSDGVDLLTTLGSAHPIYLAAGTYSSVRVKTTNTYDQGKPDTNAYHLVTTTTTSSVPLDGAATTAQDSKSTLTGYDPIDGASSTGDTSGWKQRTPTVVTQVMSTSPGTGDIIHKTLLDSSGRVLETRMPESNAADAGTTVNVYYTTASNATYPSCGGHAEWAGLLCQSGPKAQPTGTTIPTTATTSYNLWDQPLVVEETSGSKRTTTNGYDAAGRATTVAISASVPSDLGTAVPTTTTGYDSSTGDATTLTDGTTTLTTVYNSIGQVTSYTDADGQASTSTYDIDGNLKTLNDGKGTYTYTYDGTDANGKSEHRGLVTSLDVGISGSPSTFTAAYDQDGNMTVQNYPNGIQQTQTYDNTGDGRTMKYAKGGVDWMKFGSGVDREGQTVWQGSPGSYQDFGYDNNGRLTNVQDTSNGQCDVRQYTFSLNGNRTNLASGSDGGACSPTLTNSGSTYDTADRITNSGYTYDKFGRTLTVPSTDVSGGSTLTVGYYSNDMVASQTQGTKTKTFTLDPAMRLRGATDKTSGTETRRILNHYNNTDDTPTWINTSTDAGATWKWQRNVTGIGGDLAILQDSTSANSPGNYPQIQLTNPHGDVVATVDDAATGVTATNAYFESTEYGIPRATNATNPLRYGWLGGKQRSNDDLGGLTLMGVRLYNPQTGRFLSTDPVAGGNENDYAYPNNPVDMNDLAGTWGKWLRRAAKWTAYASVGACIVASAGLCGAVTVAAVAASAAWNADQAMHHTQSWKKAAFQTGIDALGARAKPMRSLSLVGRHAGEGAAAARWTASLRRGTGSHVSRSLWRGAGALARRSRRELYASARLHPIRFGRNAAVQAYYARRAHNT